MSTPRTLAGATPLPPRTRTPRLAAAIAAAGIDPAPVTVPPVWPDYVRTLAPEQSEAARRAGARRALGGAA